MVVRLKSPGNHPVVGVDQMFFEDLHAGFYEAEQEEYQVCHRQGYQQVVEVALKGLLTEDHNGSNVSQHPKHAEKYTEIST